MLTKTGIKGCPDWDLLHHSPTISLVLEFSVEAYKHVLFFDLFQSMKGYHDQSLKLIIPALLI